MNRIKIGVICPSEIAFRRFMPSLSELDEFEFAGVAIADACEWDGELTDELLDLELRKALNFTENYGGTVYKSYSSMIEDDSIDAIYLPLPPALHYKWGKEVLRHNKHLFLEKPSTTSLEDTKELVELAKGKDLALHENYMFVYHKQLEEINEIVESGEIGDVRLYRMAFGFPRRAANDFRYNKKLGGGTLLDNGGYTIKLASLLLGETAKIVSSYLNYIDGFEVDIFGTATVVNDEGLTAQIAFGMDNSYKCDLEIWGSKGTLFANRIFTAPDGFVPKLTKKVGNNPEEIIDLSADCTFKKSIEFFKSCIDSIGNREKSYSNLIRQLKLVEMIKKEN
ncbi:MAG: Gfo/Idh/MocA family oxidoreductase [Ruminococcus sp.]|nr:Gfo/Idh/MocA family oxidoreductase [Ruminococcus sp.]